MGRLIALHLDGGERFVRFLRQTWEEGDIVAPIDPRLPPAAAAALIERLRPAVVVTDLDETPTRGWRSMEPTDALVITTSGSAGTPKAVVLGHAAVDASARAGSAALSVDKSADRWLACLPLSHMGGLGVVTRALLTGTPLEVQPRVDPDAVASAARRGATLTTMVPTALRRIDPSPFRAIVVGGADVPDGMPPNVVESYGLTETCGGFVYDGRPFPGCEVRLVDGEILVRGPVLFDRYLDATTSAVDGDGWLHTGDLGRFDADGRLIVEGRRTDMIITGGENVWPAPVEDVLRSHPAIADVAVVGVDDDEWGQRVVAVFELVSGMSPPALDEVRDLIGDRLARFAAPREIVVVEALPRTGSGKVSRAAVRERLEAPRGSGPR